MYLNYCEYTILVFPTFEMREELAHLLLHLLDCEITARLSVDFIGELGAVVYHLLHSYVLRELAVLIAVDAVILVGRSIRICAENLVCERHSATLTEFHFHIVISLSPSVCLGRLLNKSSRIVPCVT